MKKILVAILMMAPLALSAQKFAHFNSADIIPNMKEYTTAQTEIQNMAKQFDDDLKLMQDELQKKAEDYDKQKSTMNATTCLRTCASVVSRNSMTSTSACSSLIRTINSHCRRHSRTRWVPFSNWFSMQ